MTVTATSPTSTRCEDIAFLMETMAHWGLSAGDEFVARMVHSSTDEWDKILSSEFESELELKLEVRDASIGSTWEVLRTQKGDLFWHWD